MQSDIHSWNNNRNFNVLMTYRNIFFKKKIIHSGNGTLDVFYTGHIYGNCDTLKDFRSMYDKSKDLYVPCTDCAANKYRKFIRISPN